MMDKVQWTKHNQNKIHESAIAALGLGNFWSHTRSTTGSYSKQ